jgi:hypothetical protein
MARSVLPDMNSLTQGRGATRKAECIVMTCDYNGWNDAPEDEREWFDQHPEIWAGPRETDNRPVRVTGQIFLRVRHRS